MNFDWKQYKPLEKWVSRWVERHNLNGCYQKVPFLLPFAPEGWPPSLQPFYLLISIYPHQEKLEIRERIYSYLYYLVRNLKPIKKANRRAPWAKERRRICSAYGVTNEIEVCHARHHEIEAISTRLRVLVNLGEIQESSNEGQKWGHVYGMREVLRGLSSLPL